MSNFTYTESDNIGIINFDQKNEKVNKLTSTLLIELSEQLDLIKKSNTIKVLLFKSSKPGIFLAGADIQEIKGLKDRPSALKIVKAGQQYISKISQLKNIITISVIEGACLGGGLEFALACDYRVASESSKVKIGLPEVKLGIIPGFGGTQRLPRLIGLQKSLPLILSGSMVDTKKAYRQKIIDDYFPEGLFENYLESFINNIQQKGFQTKIKERRSLKGIQNCLLEKTSIGRNLIFSKAKKSIIFKTKGHYPAPLKALETIRKSFNLKLEDGLKVEANGFSSLIMTTEYKNLIHLFFINEDLKKQVSITKSYPPIKTAAVIGAGLMGSGIAWLFGYRGIRVKLKDVKWDFILKGLRSINQILDKLRKKRRIKYQKQIAIMQSISGTLESSSLKKSNIIIEAIIENLAVKKKVFEELEEHVSKDTLLATNTSSLSITKIAKDLKNPERFLGIHFFSPVNMMPLVEIIPGEKTNQESIERAVTLIKDLKKVPVVVKNCPGFLINRIFLPYINEALFCLQDGGDIELIDNMVVKFGMPLGPYSLADEVGLDIGYHVLKVLEDGYGSRMALCPLFVNIFNDLKLKGKKDGKGFYKYESKDKKINLELKNYIKQNQTLPNSKIIKEDIVDRMMLMMVNEASRCLEENIVEKAEYLDMAMILGTGFPPFRGGVCKYADNLGIPVVVKKLKNFAKKYGERFTPSSYLIQLEESQSSFYK
ncbi:fatty-acid oxidation protein subunit alpha [Candidatus Marinamargulisbacteria bacterium SCGC AG-410-N11]|nr:fatty-acid oxidation protein subunit alpha [Candidatus Marinamargulisbacteria bacterium SCGC AG-410-N11]